MTTKEMAFFLRCCNAAPNDHLRDCDESCPYFTITEIPADMIGVVPADIEKNGVPCWTGCDYERISEDAARMLEVL